MAVNAEDIFLPEEGFMEIILSKQSAIYKMISCFKQGHDGADIDKQIGRQFEDKNDPQRD